MYKYSNLKVLAKNVLFLFLVVLFILQEFFFSITKWLFLHSSWLQREALYISDLFLLQQITLILSTLKQWSLHDLGFDGSGVQEWFSWLLLALGLSWGCHQDVSHGGLGQSAGLHGPGRSASKKAHTQYKWQESQVCPDYYTDIQHDKGGPLHQGLESSCNVVEPRGTTGRPSHCLFLPGPRSHNLYF